MGRPAELWTGSLLAGTSRIYQPASADAGGFGGPFDGRACRPAARRRSTGFARSVDCDRFAAQRSAAGDAPEMAMEAAQAGRSAPGIQFGAGPDQAVSPLAAR